MRTCLVVLALLLATLTQAPALRAGGGRPDAAVVVGAAQARDGGAEARKKSKSGSSSGRGTLDPIGTARRGKPIDITGTVVFSGQICELKIVYADDSSKLFKNVTPDHNKVCTFHVDVPDTSGAVGTATAQFTIKKATKGSKVGSDTQTFSVK